MTTKFQIFRSIEDTQNYQAGETIFFVGDPAEDMFVVRGGAVEILVAASSSSSRSTPASRFV